MKRKDSNRHKDYGELFAVQDLQRRLEKRVTGLDKLQQVIDFEVFRPVLEEQTDFVGESSRGGRPAFDLVVMFKVLVLQRYHDLSDEETEYQLVDRISFRKFAGIGLGQAIPDRNTIWKFKERLGSEGMEAVFAAFNRVLEGSGLSASKGKIVDATIVEVPRQRNTREENRQIKEGEVPDAWMSKEAEAKVRQKDLDARWTRKHGRDYYGYKNHVKVNAKTKLIEDFEVTNAAVHDSQCVESLVDESRDGVLHADSAYRSAAISALLKRCKVRNCVQHRAWRGGSLSARQQAQNAQRSRVRARVEHVFGFICGVMRADRLRTIGMERARRGIGLANLVYNLCRLGQLGYSMRVA